MAPVLSIISFVIIGKVVISKVIKSVVVVSKERNQYTDFESETTDTVVKVDLFNGYHWISRLV
jgi:hypothetical protein